MRLFLDIIWNIVKLIVLFARFSIILFLFRIRATIKQKYFAFNRVLVIQKGKNKALARRNTRFLIKQCNF